MTTIKLYRASDSDSISTPCAFAVELDSAKAYQDNGAFGGRNLYSASVDAENVLDLTETDMDGLADAIGSDVGYGSACEAIMHQAIADALVAAGYQWAIVRESYPADSITWILLDSALELDVEDEMTQIG